MGRRLASDKILWPIDRLCVSKPGIPPICERVLYVQVHHDPLIKRIVSIIHC